MSSSDERHSVRARLLAAHRRFIDKHISEKHPVARFIDIAADYVLIGLCLLGFAAVGPDAPQFFGMDYFTVFTYCIWAVLLLRLVLYLAYPNG